MQHDHNMSDKEYSFQTALKTVRSLCPPFSITLYDTPTVNEKFDVISELILLLNFILNALRGGCKNSPKYIKKKNKVSLGR